MDIEYMERTSPCGLDILLALVLVLGGNAAGAQDDARTPKTAPRLIEVARARIHGLELGLDGRQILLQRSGDAWVLPQWQNHPADKTYVAMLLATVCNLPKGTVVTEDPAQYGHHGLGEDAKSAVGKDAEGRTLFSLRVGNRGESYREAHILVDGRPEVRLVKADLIPALSRITWGDRTVWRLPESLILEFYLTGFSHDFHAKKVDGSWKIVKPQGAEMDGRFPQLLRQMAHLRAGNLAFRPNPRTGFRTERTVNVVTDMVSLTLELGAVKDETVPGRRGEAPVHYLFSPYFLEWLDSFTARTEPEPKP